MLGMTVEVKDAKYQGIPVDSGVLEDAQTILINARNDELQQEVEMRVEVDRDLNELRVIVGDECVWSEIFRTPH